MSTYSKISGLIKVIKDAKDATHALEALWELVWSELPHGGGIYNEVKIDVGGSQPNRLVFRLEFRKMEDGYYAGWIPYTVIVTPVFDGVSVNVVGPDGNGLKGYIADMFLLLDGEPR